MKTSNKLVLLGLVLILAAMVWFDLIVRTAYVRGDYKRYFREFVSLDLKNFNTINLNSSTTANIIVRQGPFDVKNEPYGNNYIKVTQNGAALNIDVAFSGSFQNPRYDYVMVITCPNLVKFNSDSRYMAGDLPVIDTLASADFSWRPSIIQGFKQDSLAIIARHASNIILTGNSMKSLKAVVGMSEGSASDITITGDNRFEKADINMLNRSRLRLKGGDISNLKYELADSAQLIINGASRKLAIKQ